MPPTRSPILVPLLGSLLAVTASLLSQDRPDPPGARPGVWVYAGAQQQGVVARSTPERTVTVTDTIHEGQPAWEVTLRMDFSEAVLTDTVVMLKHDLAPVSRRSVTAGLGASRYDVKDSVLSGTYQLQDKTAEIAVVVPPGAYLNYYALRLGLAGKPLRRGWVDTVAIFRPSGSGEFLEATMTVVAEESIPAPGGLRETWVVLVRGAQVGELYWVDKRTQDVVRTREPFGPDGAVLQLDLISFTPR